MNNSVNGQHSLVRSQRQEHSNTGRATAYNSMQTEEPCFKLCGGNHYSKLDMCTLHNVSGMLQSRIGMALILVPRQCI